MLPQVDRAAPLLKDGERLLLEQNYRHWSREYSILPNTNQTHKRTYCTNDAEAENTGARKGTTENENEKKARISISPQHAANEYSPLPLDCNDRLFFFFFPHGTMQHMSDLRRCNSDNLCTYYKACKELDTLKDQQETLTQKMEQIDDILKSSIETIKRNLNYLVTEYTTNTPSHSHVSCAPTNFLGVHSLEDGNGAEKRKTEKKTPEQDYKKTVIFAIPAPVQPR